MEEGIKELNKKTMKEVWDYYNRSYKRKLQTKIKVDTLEEKRSFMAFWQNLYADENRNLEM